MENFLSHDFQYRRFIHAIEPFSASDKGFFLSAYQFALENHQGQERDEGGHPIVHLLRVANILVLEIDIRNKDMISAAFLHDILEDCPVESQEIAHRFNDTVARYVELLTKKQNISHYVAEYLNPMRATGPNTMLIKLSDRLDNCRSSYFDPFKDKVKKFLSTTEQHYLPIAEQYNQYIYQKLLVAIQNSKRIL